MAPSPCCSLSLDEFAPLTDDATRRPDVHTLLASALLGAWGAPLLMLAFLVGCGGIFIAMLDIPTGPDEPSAWMIGVMGVGEALFFVMLAAPMLFASFGVLQGRTWGLWLGLVCFAMMSGSCCMPVALYGLWALLRPEGRARFGY